MEPRQILDAYLRAPRKPAALRRALGCHPQAVAELVQMALQRQAQGTLTFSELKLFARHLAAACPGGEAERLQRTLEATDPCCLRAATAQAGPLLAAWREDPGQALGEDPAQGPGQVLGNRNR